MIHRQQIFNSIILKAGNPKTGARVESASSECLVQDGTFNTMSSQHRRQKGGKEMDVVPYSRRECSHSIKPFY